MALINRISRLFRADMHAVLDHLEEPDILLKQAIREMEEDLTNDKQRIKLLQHEQKQHTQQIAELEEALPQIDDELDICFESHKDDLARNLVRRKLETRRSIKLLNKKGSQHTEIINELEKRIDENQSRLVSMQQKLALIQDNNEPDRFNEYTASPELVIQDDEVEVAFLREKQQRSAS